MSLLARLSHNTRNIAQACQGQLFTAWPRPPERRLPRCAVASCSELGPAGRELRLKPLNDRRVHLRDA